VPDHVIVLQKQQTKNFGCLLFLSNGTPMFCAGDEFMNTQGGNNNPYNQDNETTWLNRDLLQKNHDIVRFFTLRIAFRKTHPFLGHSRCWREDVHWYGVGTEVDRSLWSHSLAFCLHGSSQQDTDLYVMVNAYTEDWLRVVDTSLRVQDNFAEPGRGSACKRSTIRCKHDLSLL
jgi:isoamylase